MCFSAAVSMAMSYSSTSRASATMPSKRNWSSSMLAGTLPKKRGIHHGLLPQKRFGAAFASFAGCLLMRRARGVVQS